MNMPENYPKNTRNPVQEQMVYHVSSEKRFLAALNGWGLDVLVHDEDWLVRHTAKRAIRKEELHIQGINLEPGDVSCVDIDISDMAYELYKQDWINQHTTPESRMESVREWCAYVQKCQADDIWPERYDNTKEMFSYYEFCGAFQPEHKGLYHNQEYMCKLFGYDQSLIALYRRDIHDFISVNKVLFDASVRSKANPSFRLGEEKDQYTLE